jgi:hypothetical protein
MPRNFQAAKKALIGDALKRAAMVPVCSIFTIINQ